MKQWSTVSPLSICWHVTDANGMIRVGKGLYHAMDRQGQSFSRWLQSVDHAACQRILTQRMKHRLFWRIVRFMARFGPHLFFVEMAVILITYALSATASLEIAVRGIGIAIVAAVCTKVVIDQIGKRIERKRPFVQYAFSPLLPKSADDPSFPSNHAGGAFALGVALSLSFPAFAVVSYTLAGLLAIARVLAGLHYISDVLAGAVIGSAFALLLVRLTPHL
ncbi:MAG: phosphatase PAP2 family protein [Firmicutes bacterium]|nr:phosphatase PAP2 family protein [Bacillota bacterium]